MSDKPFSIDDWNKVVQDINALGASPPDGCDPIDPLDEVEAPHLWSVDDVQAAVDALTIICKDNVFDAKVKLWSKAIIDELNLAIGAGWCCDKHNCDDTQGPLPWKTMPGEAAIGGYEFAWFCDGVMAASPCPGYTPRTTVTAQSLMPVGTKITKEGIDGRFWRLAGLVSGGADAVMGPSGTISCDGTVADYTDTARYWGAYRETIQSCQCSDGETTWNDPQPAETSLAYFLYISGGDSPCGDHPGC